MLNKQILGELKPLYTDPAWKILLSRVREIRDQAQLKYNGANTFDEFKEAKGALAIAERFYTLFNDPTKLADDGVYQIPGLAKEA